MDTSPSKPGFARPAGLLLLFALTFAATTWGLAATLPTGEGELLHAKLETMEARSEEAPFEVAFLGSSRIYHGVAPAVFDARMLERGYQLRSFNLAITGQKVDGAYATLDSLRALELEGLEFVFVDPEDLGLMLNRLPRTMRGVVYLHDLNTSRLLLDYIWNSHLSTEQKVERSSEIVRAFSYKTTNVGRGLRWLDRLLGRLPTEEDIDFRLGPDTDGWRSKDIGPKPRSAEAHRQFLERPKQWTQQVAHLRGRSPAEEPLHEKAIPLATRIEDLGNEMGAEVIFFISPATALQGQLINAHERGVVQNLFRFNDPEEYPELFTQDARWEAAHLSAVGARRFSERLADRFADWLDARREAGR